MDRRGDFGLWHAIRIWRGGFFVEGYKIGWLGKRERLGWLFMGKGRACGV